MSMKLNVNSWYKYKLSDIFCPFVNGKGITEQEIKDHPGKLAAVQSSSDNNACMGWIDEEYCKEMKYKIIYEPCLTVARSGSAGFVSVQPWGCVIGDSAKGMILQKQNVNIYHYLFIRTVLMKNMYRYNYGRKVKAEQYMEMDILLPTGADGKVDWEFMEQYIKSLHCKPIFTKQINKKVDLNINNWKKFVLSDLFEIKKGKRLTKAEMLDGTVNFLGAIASNNGVRQKIDISSVFKPNCITVNYNGSVGEAFYQKEPFWASDDVNVLYAKDFWKMNKYNAMFLITVIKSNKYRFGYGRKWTLDKMKETVIKLPAKEDGTPNFAFMEDYIKNLPYGDRI